MESECGIAIVSVGMGKTGTLPGALYIREGGTHRVDEDRAELAKVTRPRCHAHPISGPAVSKIQDCVCSASLVRTHHQRALGATIVIKDATHYLRTHSRRIRGKSWPPVSPRS